MGSGLRLLAVNMSVKTEGEKRQTGEGVIGLWSSVQNCQGIRNACDIRASLNLRGGSREA